MRSLLRFIVNNQFVLLFLLLEIISLVLIVRNNTYPQTRYVNWAQQVNGYFSEKKSSYTQYLSLREVNLRLAAENATLRNEMDRLTKMPENLSILPKDTVGKKQYQYILAKVVDNSVNKQYNYLTLNKGSRHGIKPEMAVICADGVVGVVEDVTENYALVMSLLNRNIKVSAKFKKNDFFGPFEWGGTSYRKGFLTDIPLHVQILPGDTIVTSGFSSIFPEGLPIGYVNSYGVSGGNFYKIELTLTTDFRSISNVYVVENFNKSELKKLESTIK